MASSVRPRPNHYETLGLLPSASEDEISRAFGRLMGMFGARSVAATAQMSLAFEVLRNPAKRRAYDKALGLRVEPDASHWAVGSVVARSSPGFLGSGWTRLAEQVVGDSSRPSEAGADPSRAVNPSEPKVGQFVAAALRDAPKPITRDRPPESPARSEAQRPEKAKSHSALERDIQQLLASRAQEKRSDEVEYSPLDLKRPALAVGGLLALAAVIGALAGVSIKNDEQEPSSRHADNLGKGARARHGGGPIASLTSPRETAVAGTGVAISGVATTSASTPVGKDGARSFVTAARRQATQFHPPAQLAPIEAGQVDEGQLDQGQVDQAQVNQGQVVQGQVPQGHSTDKAVDQPVPAASDPLAPEATAKPVAADLPLPRALIARTIDRIGFSCGKVVSSTAVDGAAGVYSVTCSSGQTYEASPVHGRYRFRRTTSH